MNYKTKEQLINFEQRIVGKYLNLELPFLFHLSGGNEDALIDIFKGINEGDWIISNHRSHYHALLAGIPEEVVEDRIANGRSMFIFDKNRRFFTSAIIGGTPAIAAGIALSLKEGGSKNKVVCFVGDGTEDSGHLFEAARYVDGFDLPCVFIVEDNNRSVDTSKDIRWGKSADPAFPRCVQKYKYDITYPHARTNDRINIKNLAPKKTDSEYFPELKEEYPNGLMRIDVSNDTSYKDGVNLSMQSLAEKGFVVLGYNVRFGESASTFKPFEEQNKIETPVAENLMVGLAIGLSLTGVKTIVYIERHDFMLVAADAIVNHLNYIERISHGEFTTPVILKTVVADGGFFYSGPTHSQNFTDAFKQMVKFPIYVPKNGKELVESYNKAAESMRPSMIVEKKSLF